MRTSFDGELDQWRTQLSAMCAVAAGAMQDASRALLDSDLGLAEQVIAVGEQMHPDSSNGSPIKP